MICTVRGGPCSLPFRTVGTVPPALARSCELLAILTAAAAAKFRGIPCISSKIPSSAGSQKTTSVDTLMGTRR